MKPSFHADDYAPGTTAIAIYSAHGGVTLFARGTVDARSLRVLDQAGLAQFHVGDEGVGQKQFGLRLLYIRPATEPEYSQHMQSPAPSKLQTTSCPLGQVPSEHALTFPVTAAQAFVACALLMVPSATQS
jgi:hypothetical protein